jgi:hypothetical protein
MTSGSSRRAATVWSIWGGGLKNITSLENWRLHNHRSYTFASVALFTVKVLTGKNAHLKGKEAIIIGYFWSSIIMFPIFIMFFTKWFEHFHNFYSFILSL